METQRLQTVLEVKADTSEAQKKLKELEKKVNAELSIALKQNTKAGLVKVDGLVELKNSITAATSALRKGQSVNISSIENKAQQVGVSDSGVIDTGGVEQGLDENTSSLDNLGNEIKKVKTPLDKFIESAKVLAAQFTQYTADSKIAKFNFETGKKEPTHLEAGLNAQIALQKLASEMANMMSSYNLSLSQVKDTLVNKGVDKQIVDQASKLVDALNKNTRSKSSDSLKDVSKNFSTISRAIIGVRSLFFFVRKIVSQNENLQNELTTFFETLGNAVKPLLDKIADIMNWVSQFIAKIFGVAVGNKKANESTAKSLAGFDEINNLSSSSGTLAQPTTKPFPIPALLNVAGKIHDIIFDWDDLSMEDISEKLNFGLGGVLGYMVGGIPGAIVGMILGGAIDEYIFDDDGVLDFGEQIITDILTGITAAFAAYKYFKVKTAGGLLSIGLAASLVMDVGLTIGKLVKGEGDVGQNIMTLLVDALEAIGLVATWGTGWTLLIAGIAAVIKLLINTDVHEDEPAAQKVLSIIDTIPDEYERQETLKIVTNPELANVDELERFFNRIGIDGADELVNGVKQGTLTNKEAVDKAIINSNWFNSAQLKEFEENGGVNIMAGVVEGLEDGTYKYEYKAKNIFQRIGDWFKGIFGIHSPSTVFAGYGKNLLEGLHNGLSENLNKITNFFTTIFNNIKNSLSSTADTIKTKVSNTWNSLKTNTINSFNSIKTGLSNIWNSIWTNIKNILNKILGGIENMVNSAIDGINNGIIGGLIKLGSKLASKLGWSIPSALSHISIPRLSVGTDMVNTEGLAYLHAGEAVVPANVVQGGFTGNNSDILNKLDKLIDVVDSKEFKTYISQRDIGNAAVSYINSQNRILGGNLI